MWSAYCDGSCLGNPGPGGYGWTMTNGSTKKEGGGKRTGTTNNQMELLAVIDCLAHIPEEDHVTIHSDSTYVINGITRWIPAWIRKGFEGVKNSDLWCELLEQVGGRGYRVTWVHVRGHAGIEGNERADAIARGFASDRPIILQTS